MGRGRHPAHVAILTDEQLTQFHALATEAGLAVLVEVHDEEELERALKISPVLLGVNNRNLKTFKVDLATTEQLASKIISHGALLVAESGIHTRADVERCAAVWRGGHSRWRIAREAG